MALANAAITTNGTRIASGKTGSSRASRSHRRPPPAARVPARTTSLCSVTKAITYLPGQPEAGVDIGVEDVDDQVDHHDHNAGLHDDSLHEREVALKNALVQEPADARPGKDHLDDHRRVEHDDEVYAGQGEHRNERVLEGVHRDHDVAPQALQPGQLDVFAAQ